MGSHLTSVDLDTRFTNTNLLGPHSLNMDLPRYAFNKLKFVTFMIFAHQIFFSCF
jgi:hypothetical protein